MGIFGTIYEALTYIGSTIGKLLEIPGFTGRNKLSRTFRQFQIHYYWYFLRYLGQQILVGI